MALTDRVAFSTLADLKADLGITDSAQDAALERRILAAAALIERYTARQFRRETARVEAIPGYGTTRLLPALTPILAVASVVYDDGTTVDPSRYFVEKDSRGEGWALYAEAGWDWSAPGIQTIDARPVLQPGMERPAFSVTYSGGYALPNDTTQAAPFLPLEIVEASTMLAATLWHQRGRDANVASEAVGEASISLGAFGGRTAADSLGIPGHVAAMLDGARRAV